MKSVTRSLVAAAAAVLLSFSGARAANPTEVTFGIAPTEAPTVMFKKYTPLKDFLEKETGAKIKLAVAKDYQGAVDAMGKGETSVAKLTPATLLKVQKQYPDAKVEAFARWQENGKGMYNGSIIVPADSPITKIEEVKGKKVGFGSKDSTSSNLSQRAMLKDAGIDADKDVTAEFLGSHSNVVKAVELKKVEVGCCKKEVAEKAVKEGKAKIIASSADLPDEPFVFSGKMPAELRAKFEAAFKKLNDGSAESKAVLAAVSEKYTGTEVAVNADYEVIRKMIATLYGDAYYAKAE